MEKFFDAAKRRRRPCRTEVSSRARQPLLRLSSLAETGILGLRFSDLDLRFEFVFDRECPRYEAYRLAAMSAQAVCPRYTAVCKQCGYEGGLKGSKNSLFL